MAEREPERAEWLLSAAILTVAWLDGQTDEVPPGLLASIRPSNPAPV